MLVTYGVLPVIPVGRCSASYVYTNASGRQIRDGRQAEARIVPSRLYVVVKVYVPASAPCDAGTW